VTDTHDRRRHPRYDIELQGLLMDPGGPARRCVVRDYCLGGLLVELAGAPGGAAGSGDRVRIDAKLSLPDGLHPIAMNAVVVWQRDAHLGLSFDASSSEYFDLLERHGQVEAVGAKRGPESGSEARARARLRHAATSLLPTLLREVLVATNTRLLDLADRMRSNSEQSQLFADLNQLDRTKQSDCLGNAVLQQWEDPRPAVDATEQGSELSLIDPEEFERWLESSRVATLLDRQFSDTLCALTSRLAALREAGAPREQSAPFEPQHFTKAIQEVARELHLGRATRVELFEAARQVLADRLAEFYATLHRALDELGVPQAAPEKYRVSKGAADRKAGWDVGPADECLREGGSAGPETPQADPAVQRDRGGPGRSPAASVSVAPGLVSPELIARGRRSVSAARGTHATSLLNEAVAGEQVTASLRDWLQLLEAPLKRAAAADPALFNDDSNPLRQIIDALGHLELFRPVPDGPPETDEVRQQVDELLRPLQDATVDEAKVVAIAQRVAELTDQQSQRYQQNVERVVEASEGRERVRQARLRVIETLNDRYGLKEMPEVTVEMLDTGWRSVLELALLRGSDAEDLFADRLGVVDDLTAALGGQAYDDERTRLGAQALLETVRDELATAAFDPFRVAAVLKRMTRELTEAGDASRTVRFAPLVADDADGPCFAPPAGIADDQWPLILGRCDEIRVADRLRFVHPGSGQASELRVAWIRPDRGLFTLVDHRGIRQRDIVCADLALGLHRREILLESVDGVPLSERATDSLLARMEERLAHEAAHDSLTGLINRNQFRAALEQLLRRSEGASGAMLSIDIDQFRLVNEIHGYDNGDRLLVAVARMLEKAKGFSVLSHIGGDRFAMLLPETPLDQAARHAETIREQISSMPFSVATHALSVSVSIGVIAVTADEVIGNLMQSVEDALSAAKANGGKLGPVSVNGNHRLSSFLAATTTGARTFAHSVTRHCDPAASWERGAKKQKERLCCQSGCDLLPP